MRLTELYRTTGSRLTLFLLLLFGLASLLLFTFIYWSTTSYLTSGVDDFLQRERAAFQAAPRSELPELLNRHARLDPLAARPFGLFSPQGAWIAGNLHAPPRRLIPMDRPFPISLSWGGRPSAPYRALAHTLASGELLIVTDAVSDHREFETQLLVSMVWASLIAFAFAIAGAAVVAITALRRIDAFTNSIEHVMRGDLHQRLPAGAGNGDLDRLARVVNQMLDEIERLVGEVKGVTDDVAHDLRTPLTRLLAGLERVRRRESPRDEYVAAVEQAIDDVGGVLQTFNALLRISEISAGARRAGFTRVDLASVAADVVEFYEPVAEAKGVRLNGEGCDRAGAAMVGDPALLFEAIGNLVDNAIKFTPAGGCVDVVVERRGRILGVSVSDTGVGIAPGDVDLVLQPFRRGESSRHTAGNGLGLAIVAAVAKLHQLSIIIEAASPGCRMRLETAGATREDAGQGVA